MLAFEAIFANGYYFCRAGIVSFCFCYPPKKLVIPTPKG